MGMEGNFGKTQTSVVETKKTLDEKRAALKGVNINDIDIIEKLSGVLGTDKESFNDEELKSLKDYVAERKGHWEDNMGWKEWTITKTGDVLFVNPDGSIGVKES
jgi:hypothetical protein